MVANFRNMKLARKLPIAIGLFVAFTITVMSAVNVVLTHRIISIQAEEKLDSVGRLKSQRVKALLDAIDRDLRLQAASPTTVTALIALADGFQQTENASDRLRRVYIDENKHPVGSKDKLVKADTGSNYGPIHGIYHPNFDAIQDEMDYYDVFLFDTEGNLIYSVFKENDFATNMITGPWADSGLAEAYRQAAENDVDGFAVVIAVLDHLQPVLQGFQQLLAFDEE